MKRCSKKVGNWQCKEAPAPDRKMCQKHIDIINGNKRDARARQKAKGLCTVIGCKVSHLPDLLMCALHQSHKREACSRYEAKRSGKKVKKNKSTPLTIPYDKRLQCYDFVY